MLLVSALLLCVLVPVQPASSVRSLETEINKTGGALVYGVAFDAGTASLQPKSDEVLQQIVALMREHSDWRFEVQGHTAEPGGRALNLALSGKRATAVVEWLVAHGVDGERLVSKAYGDTRPVAPGSADESRRLNSRVQLRKLNEE